jgi:hypothetical protein
VSHIVIEVEAAEIRTLIERAGFAFSIEIDEKIASCYSEQCKVVLTYPVYADGKNFQIGVPPQSWTWESGRRAHWQALDEKKCAQTLVFLNDRFMHVCSYLPRLSVPIDEREAGEIYWKLRGYLDEMEHGAKSWCA